MDEDIEDIRKLDEILKKEIENANNLQEEIDEFINCISDEEEHLEGFETENINFEEFDVNKLDEIASNFCNVSNINFSNDLSLIKYYLKKEEIKVINSCRDPQLKKLLILNRVKFIQLQNINVNLYETLKKCTAYIKDTELTMKEFYKKPQMNRKSILPRLGHPYFKGKNTVSCQPNSDTVRKRKNKELSIDYLPPVARWTLEDQMVLNRAVIFNYYSNSIEQLEKRLKTLQVVKKTSTDSETIKLVTSDIEEAEVKLTELKNCKDPTPPPLECSEVINWVYISNEDLKGRHSPWSCKSFWNVFLHPSINKLNWSDEENQAIKTLVKKYNCQNWDAIASRLGSNRSGFSICVHYHARLSEKFKKDRFEPEEDAFLMELVDSCRIGNYIPWTKVAHQFDNRTKNQIYHRYRYYLMYKNVTKGAFSEAEDVLLLCLINKFGKDFSVCSRYMKNRSPMQLSHRYNNYLKRDGLNFGNWTIAEDKKIMEHVRNNGPKWWGTIIGILRRNRTHIRQRYLVLSKWLENHPGQTVDDMPRRRQSYKQKVDLQTIRATANWFKESKEIPSLAAIKSHLKIVDKNIVLKAEKKETNHLIDSELINFFQSTCKVKTGRKVTQESLEQVVDTVKAFLSLMEVTLEIPDDNTLSENPLLDQLDLEILGLLKQPTSNNSYSTSIKQKHVSLPSCSQNILSTSVTEVSFNKCGLPQNQVALLPPNINTLVGLRSMLITYNVFKKKLKDSSNATNLQEAKSKFSWSTQQDYLKLNDGSRRKVFKEQQLFEKRFTILFKWPCLMSIVEPYENLNLLNTSVEPVSEEKTEIFRRKVGRPRKDLTKVNLMLKAKLKKALEKRVDANKPESDIQKQNPPKILNGLSLLQMTNNSNAKCNQETETTVKPDFIFVKPINTNQINYGGGQPIKTVLKPNIVDKLLGVSAGVPANQVIKLKKIKPPISSLGKPLNTIINSRKRQTSEPATRNVAQKMKIEEVNVKVEINDLHSQYISEETIP